MKVYFDKNTKEWILDGEGRMMFIEGNEPLIEIRNQLIEGVVNPLHVQNIYIRTFNHTPFKALTFKGKLKRLLSVTRDDFFLYKEEIEND